MAALQQAFTIFNAADAAGLTVQLNEWRAHVETELFDFRQEHPQLRRVAQRSLDAGRRIIETAQRLHPDGERAGPRPAVRQPCGG